MITPEEQTQIETIRPIMSRSQDHTFMKNLLIREAGRDIKNCGCNQNKRQILKTQFFTWYDNNYQSTPIND